MIDAETEDFGEWAFGNWMTARQTENRTDKADNRMVAILWGVGKTKGKVVDPTNLIVEGKRRHQPGEQSVCNKNKLKEKKIKLKQN